METSVNNECKAFTSLEQSKKLAEILPLESADMRYIPIMDIDSMSNSGFLETPECYPYSDVINCYADYLPCWSLAALLGVLPKIVNHETLFIENSAALWHIGYRNIYTARAGNPVDACYELILKLNELKML